MGYYISLGVPPGHEPPSHRQVLEVLAQDRDRFVFTPVDEEENIRRAWVGDYRLPKGAIPVPRADPESPVSELSARLSWAASEEDVEAAVAEIAHVATRLGLFFHLEGRWLPPDDLDGAVSAFCNDFSGAAVGIRGLFGTVRGDKARGPTVMTTEQREAWGESRGKAIAELTITPRARNCLEKSGILTIGELVGKTEAEILESTTCGRKSLREIKGALTAIGLALGLTTHHEPDD